MIAKLVEGLEDVVWYFDDLFADWGAVTTRLLYRKCREQGSKSCWLGKGRMRSSAGIPSSTAARHGRGPTIWQLFQLFRRYAGRRHGRQFREFAGIMRRYLAQCGGSMFDAVRLFESRNQLPNNYVMKVDKASMSVSVEARAPYLDRRVAEVAYSIPEQYLLANGTDKEILRCVAERHSLLPPRNRTSSEVRWVDCGVVDG
jgi:asparagine synthetase B (glutamine-hydrolysing)